MKYFKLCAPFLMALFTVTSLWAANAERIDAGQIWPPLIFAFFIAGLFLLLAWLFPPTSKEAGFVGAFFTLAFLLGTELGGWLALLLAGIALFIALFKPLARAREHIVVIVPAILAIAIPFTVVQGAVNHISDNGKLEAYESIPGQPNIYFLVPDRMPSPASMRESGLDPSEVVFNFEARGFIVPDDMMSADKYQIGDSVNTTRTMRFFASVLNFGLDIPEDIDYGDARKLIKDPELFRELHSRGYSVTNIGSWFQETATFPTADVNLRYDDVSFMEHLFYEELSLAYFNRTLLSGLNLRVWESDDAIKNVEQGRHDWQFQTLVDIAVSGKTSQFVMSHILLPHEPFIYSEADDKFDRYLDQIEYAEIYLIELAQEIRRLDPHAYIIIQSDEGMAFRSPVSLNEDLTPRQWNGVFSAWYSPGEPLYAESHTHILQEVLENTER